MILSAQLFGICFNSPLPVEETLAKLKDLGYSAVEPCVATFRIPNMDKAIWPVEDFETYMPKIQELGLNVESVHFFGNPLNACIDEMQRLAKTYGIKYFVVKTPQDMSLLSLQKASMEYLTVADALAEVGAKLLLHNEQADIAEKIHGKTAYEYLLDLCQDRVFAQVDVGWVYMGGENVMELLKRNKTRIAAIHYKDFDAEGQQTIIGKGMVDTQGAFAFARANGFPHIADMDSFPGDMFEAMGQVYMNLNMIGQSRTGTSYLNIMNIETGEIQVLKAYPDQVIEAPNWMHTTDELVYNSNGHLYAYKLEDGTEREIDTGECVQCNNDHVLAPDETGVAVSNTPTGVKGFASYVYTILFATGEAKMITPNSPSFLHGWSPDGKDLLYCGFRMIDGKIEVDVYAIPADGSGEEVRLTNGGFNDGCEYSPDGEYIWYHSTNSGLMQAWRMKRDGSEQTQMTCNDRNNWFPHISPDNQKVVYIAYHEGHLSPNEHLPNMQVELWLMNADGSDQHRILSFFGGQGSLNVNSWAADSKRFAFVSYEM